MISLSSVTISQVVSGNQGTDILGALGAITGGGNSFNFNESNSDSTSETAALTDGYINQNNTASFTEAMLGTETYGAAGAITGVPTRSRGCRQHTTSPSSPRAASSEPWARPSNGASTVIDVVGDTLSDVGTDVLGTSDSILGGCDAYSESLEHELGSTFLDYGTTGSPVPISRASAGTTTTSRTPATAHERPTARF